MPQKNTAYLNDPVWISWKALVEVETYALREQFLLEDITALDDLMLDHQRKHALVTECKGKFKPKLLYRKHYPVDIRKFRPLVRIASISIGSAKLACLASPCSPRLDARLASMLVSPRSPCLA